MPKFINGSEKYTEAGIDCTLASDKCSQAYEEIVSCCRYLAKDYILQQHIIQKVL